MFWVDKKGRTRHKPSNIKGLEGRNFNDQRPSMGGVVVSPHRERLSSNLLDTLSSKMLDKITPDGATKNAK